MSQNNRRTIRGVHFLKLQGTEVERAKSYGELLKNEIPHGPLSALAKKNEWLIRRSPGVLQWKPLQDSVVQLYKKVFAPLIASRFTKEESDVAQAFANACGIPLEVCQESALQPDTLMLLCRLSLVKHLIPEWSLRELPGCSSAVVPPALTQSGRMLVCRNLDYPLVGPWESQTTVSFHEPEDKSEIPHVSVASAGVFTSGLTSMNREGLTLATHAHFGKNVSLQGRPIVCIGNDVIRKARTLGQAVDICRKAKRIGNWSFVVSSAKEKSGVIIQMTSDQTRVCEPSDFADQCLVHSNYFHAEDLQKSEALLSGGSHEDLQDRVCRMRQILAEHRGHLEPKHLSAALGDQRDSRTGEERAFGGTLGVVTTVASVVFEPESQKLWVSARGESPMGLGDFLEVDVDRFWNSPSAESDSLPILPGYQPQNPALINGIRLFREAYRAWHLQNDRDDFAERALSFLDGAIAAYPQDGHLWLQGAMVAFHLGKFEKARPLLEEALKRSLSEHLQGVGRLFLGRCWDLLGQRGQAIDLYRSGLNAREPRLRTAFQEGLKHPYRAKDCGKMMIDLQFPDPFMY